MDEETRYQIVIAIAGVLLFVVATVIVGMLYGEGTNGVTSIQPAGAPALVGPIALFILLMAGLGVWLDRQDFES